jgi:GxxExxY protein
MPIKVFADVRVFNQEEFHALDRRVMRVVFDVHNDFGRLLEESIYQLEIASRLAKLGMVPVEHEVRIQVAHDSFAKDYYMDLLLASGVPVELKTVETLAPAHRAQALNYLLLAGLRHGRLVNLRPERVQHEFVSTSLTPEERRKFSLVDAEWRAVSAKAAWLRETVIEVLHDWGAFLEVTLYRDAITHFLGGNETVHRSRWKSWGRPAASARKPCISSQRTRLSHSLLLQEERTRCAITSNDSSGTPGYATSSGSTSTITRWSS